MKTSRAILLGLGAAAGTWALRRTFGTNYSLGEKVVLITGGSRGLGLVLARQVCAAGGKVALLARDAEELARAQDELAARGGEVFVQPCDLCVPAQVASAFRAVLEHFGRLDLLVNNAGIIEVGPLEHMQRADFEKSMQLHFWAAYDLIALALPHFRARGGGRIINIASIGGKIAVPHLAPYCASKFALVGLSESLRAELASQNIFVTTVVPGMMRTGSHVNARFKGNHAAEFAWFAVANATPLLSASAERAAAQILRACRRGQPSLTITLPARIAIAGNALFPNLTAHATAIATRFLPARGEETADEARSGRESRAHSAVPGWMTHFADRASGQNNET